jgi:hypothetical protein
MNNKTEQDNNLKNRIDRHILPLVARVLRENGKNIDGKVNCAEYTYTAKAFLAVLKIPHYG